MKKLKVEREKRKISQHQLGKMIGISQNFLCDIENGKRKLKPEVAQKIAKVFNVNWYDLYQ